MQLARARALTKEYEIEVHTRVIRGYELATAVLRECARVEPGAVFLALDVSSSRWGIPYLPAIIRQMIRSAPCPVYIAHAPARSYPTADEGITEVERVLQMGPE